jgi:hypothetical protein
MAILKTVLKTGALGALVAAGALAASASAALADTVCNKWGECWHVHERYTTYPADAGITFYTDPDFDTWKAHHHHRLFKDRDDDHGYYDEHGHWTAFAH